MCFIYTPVEARDLLELEWSGRPTVSAWNRPQVIDLCNRNPQSVWPEAGAELLILLSPLSGHKSIVSTSGAG